MRNDDPAMTANDVIAFGRLLDQHHSELYIDDVKLPCRRFGIEMPAEYAVFERDAHAEKEGE
ncbi:MAG: hypothetical protein JW934_02480 [Anaerolineae bacterium]|nr:hypothetical protein [Anaerolineae bacterium]